MIRDIVLAVEQRFANDWALSPVNYDLVGYTPTVSEFIEIQIVPISSYNNSLQSCTFEDFELHVSAYGKTKVEAGVLVDEVVAFLQNTQINELRVRTWRQIANGTLDTGAYFYKIIFDAQA